MIAPLIVDVIHESPAPLLEKPKRLLEDFCENRRYVMRCAPSKISERGPAETAFLL
jgi:hypothetical protein